MKRLFLVVSALLFLRAIGQAQNVCASYTYLQEQERLDPGMAARLASIQAFSRRAILSSEVRSGVSGPGNSWPVIRIPVVVHILYKDGSQNISDQQVYSQIDALNGAFRRTHADTSLTPDVFKPLSADCYVEFSLAQIDPQGYATSGIVRHRTGMTSFNVDDKIKYSSQGGDDAWDPNRYLNIWVGNMAGGIIGYSSVLGGPAAVDGIVVRYQSFGTVEKAAAPYNKGRTAVHEVGHWLGLRHIWGDAYCGDDGIDDTPPQRSGTNGCPSGTVISCNNGPNGNMYMNYMDVTYDACTNLFTPDQRAEMRSLFAEGGPRHALLLSNGITGIPLPGPPPSQEENVPAGSWRLSPNPAYQTVQLEMNTDDFRAGLPVKIYNRLGQCVWQTSLQQPRTSLQLDRLPDGLYFVKVGNDLHPQKLLKVSSGFYR